jgi:hypothetical protein
VGVKSADRGFKPERTVMVKEDNVSGVHEWVTRYHKLDPNRISVAERRSLVERRVGMIRRVQAAFPMSKVNYLSMFPRHVAVCCGEHMTEEDVWMVGGIRRVKWTEK